MSTAPTPYTFFHSTRRVIVEWEGIGRLADLAREHGARRPAAVLDEYFMAMPVRERIERMLREACGAAPAVHAIPAREPDLLACEACARALDPADPDFVVVVGGGSAIDAAKVARMLLANPGPAEAITLEGGAVMKPHPSLMVAVPTTAGTGSEVSESAVIHRAGHRGDAKAIFRSQDMTPQVALLDAALTVSAPRLVSACAGYDAVTHAVESYISRMASPMTDPYARSAMELLGRWLPVVMDEPAHPEARTACLVASLQAAIAFNSANLGLAHAISGPLGAQQGVAHGLGNALALPYTIAFNRDALGDKGREIARCFGGVDPVAALAGLRHRLGLDVSLDAYVRTDAERERLAHWAMKSGQVRMNPREITLDDMRGILEAMRTPTGAAPSR